MQAFRAKATVNEAQELLVTRVPFPPGAELEIIVLDQGSGNAKADESVSPPVESQQRPSLAEDQYRLAAQYPGEYVLLVGAEVLHHSRNREEIVKAFRKAWADSPSKRPVVVAPGGKPNQKPVFRGRSLTAALGK